MTKSPNCPRCGQPVEVPESAACGDEACLAAFLQQEGDTCLALTNALANPEGLQMTWSGVAVGIGGYGSMTPEGEAWGQRMGECSSYGMKSPPLARPYHNQKP